MYSKHLQGEGDLAAGEGLSVADVCHSTGARCGPYGRSGASSLIYNPNGTCAAMLWDLTV